MNDRVYAGFWIRVGAAMIDSVLIMIIIVPILTFLSGKDYYSSGSIIIGYVLPALAVIVFWIYKSATPGKMMTKISIVDAKTGDKPSTGQFIGRYLGYYVSTIPLLLGIIWIAFDKRKQGWHDKLAGTVVIRDNSTNSGSSKD